MELDKIDKKILIELQENNRISNNELAHRVAVSAPTCLRRVRRLRKEGVIEADVSLINQDYTQAKLTIIVGIQLREETRSQMKALEKQMLELDSVTQCYLVTGEVDYLLHLKVRDMPEYERFSDEYLYSNKMIKRFLTFASLKQLKFSTYAKL